MKRLKTLLTIIALTCSAVVTMLAQEQTATIYVIRQNSGFTARLDHTRIKCDGVKLVSIPNNKYVVLHIPAGQHTIEASGNDAKNGAGIPVTLRPGEVRYFRVYEGLSLSFYEIQPAEAQRELHKHKQYTPPAE